MLCKNISSILYQINVLLVTQNVKLAQGLLQIALAASSQIFTLLI
jgi:hypothetical protein